MYRPAQDSSVWLGLPIREQLMSQDCPKHQVVSLAKMVVMNKETKICAHSLFCRNSQRMHDRAKLLSVG